MRLKNLEQIARRERQLFIEEVCDTSLFVLLMPALVKDPNQQLVIFVNPRHFIVGLGYFMYFCVSDHIHMRHTAVKGI